MTKVSAEEYVRRTGPLRRFHRACSHVSGKRIRLVATRKPLGRVSRLARARRRSAPDALSCSADATTEYRMRTAHLVRGSNPAAQLILPVKVRNRLKLIIPRSWKELISSVS
eukprot:2895550-Heterocapsa_arctica.AAC.1